jgi:hypothetical protein
LPGPPSDRNERNVALSDELYDVLNRQSVVDEVRYGPDAIQKRYLEATVHPERVSPSTGPEPPTITVKWDTTVPFEWFRIDDADPDTGFHCGWHYDHTHEDLGEAHFQYQRSGMVEPERRPAGFEFESPPRILWECLDRLFGEVLPRLVEG